MAYGTIKVDTITFTDNDVDKSVSISGLVQNPTFSGNIAVTGTVSGDTIQGQIVSGVTVTGTTANFVSGVFTTQISGATVVGSIGNFTTFTGGTITVTSGVIASGTEANPSLSILGDANTGLYSPGAYQLAISTAGSGRLFVDSTGKVGIGGASVAGLLQLKYATDVHTSFRNATAGGLSAGTLIESVNDAFNSYNPIYLKGSQFAFGTDAAGSFVERLRITSTGTVNIVGAGTAGSTQAVSFNGSAPVDSLVLTSGGLVGVGVSEPGYRLDVQSGSLDSVANFQNTVANTYGAIRITGNNRGGQLDFYDGTTGQAAIWGNSSTLNFGTGSSFTQAMIIDSSGNVAIGTTSADSAGLTLRNPVSITGQYYKPAGYYGIDIGPVDNTSTKVWAAVTSSYNQPSAVSAGLFLSAFFADPGGSGCGYTIKHDRSSQSLAFSYVSTGASVGSSANETERARIDSSGRLLVGTSSSYGTYPASLQIQNNSGYAALFSKFSNSASGPDVEFFKGRGGSSASVRGIVQNNDTLGVIEFSGDDGTNGGITAAMIRAFVDGTPGANDMPGRLVFSTTADGQASPTPRMTIQNDGDVLIGRTSELGSVHRLVIERDNLAVGINTFNGGNNEAIRFYNAGTPVGTISTTGSATAYNTSSDYRLKENVTAVTDGITRLQQLKPSRFNFIVDPDKTVDGFIAHEVQAVVPEAITGEKDAVDDEGSPVYQGIDQSKLVPLLTAALQEAVAKIESLEARLDAANL